MIQAWELVHKNFGPIKQKIKECILSQMQNVVALLLKSGEISIFVTQTIMMMILVLITFSIQDRCKSKLVLMSS